MYLLQDFNSNLLYFFCIIKYYLKLYFLIITKQSDLRLMSRLDCLKSFLIVIFAMKICKKIVFCIYQNFTQYNNMNFTLN